MLTKLPLIIKKEIFSYLSTDDLKAVSFTNRSNLQTSEFNWQEKVLTEFKDLIENEMALPIKTKTWQYTYEFLLNKKYPLISPAKKICNLFGSPCNLSVSSNKGVLGGRKVTVWVPH